MDELPVSTKWTLDAAGKLGRISIESVFLIFSKNTQQKGTGFLLSNGYIVTNEHVIRENTSSKIIAFSSSGNEIHFSKCIFDSSRDLALLLPSEKLEGGLLLGTDKMQVGTMVSTWGFPLGYNGPPPLLTVGFLSGFKEYEENSKKIKHLIVNGAFNPGNSGGPLFASNDNKVVGIVVSKHVPFTQFQKSALEALAGNQSGVVFRATDEKGEQRPFVESQLVADLLTHLRNLTQVMIGEAISVNELKEFLNEESISVPS